MHHVGLVGGDLGVGKHGREAFHAELGDPLHEGLGVAQAEDGAVDRLVQGAVVATFNRLVGDADMDVVVDAFRSGRSVETGEAKASTDYQRLLQDVDGLAEVVGEITRDERPQVQASAIEFVLEGLHLNKRLNKDESGARATYRARA